MNKLKNTILSLAFLVGTMLAIGITNANQTIIGAKADTKQTTLIFQGTENVFVTTSSFVTSHLVHDSAPFTARAVKNSTTQNIVAFNGATKIIRVYNAGDGNGGELVVALTDESYLITGIDIDYNASTASTAMSLKADDTVIYSGSAGINVTHSYSELSATQFSIKNTNTTTAQIFIDNIVITYASASPGVTLDSIAFTSAPSQTSYYVGETINMAGAVVTAYWSNETETIVTAAATYSPQIVESDTTEIEASYQGKTAVTPISIIVRTLSTINITTLPNRVSYRIGSSLDLTGLVVTATFDDSSNDDVTDLATILPGQGYTFVEDDYGTVTVLVTYEDKEASFQVIVDEALVPEYIINVTNNSQTEDMQRTLNSTVMPAITQPASNLLQTAVVAQDPLDTAVRVFYGAKKFIIDGIQPVRLGSGAGYGNILFTFAANINVSSVTLYAAKLSVGVLKPEGGYYDSALQINDAEPQVVGVAGQTEFTYNAYTYEGTFGHLVTMRNSTTAPVYVFGFDIEYEIMYTPDAGTWAGSFLSQTSVCDPTGASNNVSSLWSQLNTDFSALSPSVRLEIKNGHSDEFGNVLERALARYDYIVAKYGLADFIERGSLDKSQNMEIGISANNFLLIALIAISAVSCAISVIYIKKETPRI